MTQVKAIRRFTVRTVLPESIRPLARLATNLRWSWHRPTRELFEGLNPAIWDESAHDPVSFLGLVSREELQRLAADQDVVRRVHAAAEDLDRYLDQPRWYQSLGDDAPSCIAYFSPEFGITEVLPQYSGGLGILAGDHLKAASDLGVVVPGPVPVMPGFNGERPVARAGGRDDAFPAVRALSAVTARRGQPDALAFLAFGIEQHRADSELVVSFAEYGRSDYEPLPRERLRWKRTSVHDGLHGSDREPAKTQAFRDQGLRFFAGSGTGSRISRHKLDVI